MNRKHILFAVLLSSFFAWFSSIGYGQAKPERSVNKGGRPVDVAFANQTAGHVTAHWIDYQGGTQQIGTILPGQIVKITTFPGHITIFTAGGRRLSTFHATSFCNGTAYGISGAGIAPGAYDPRSPQNAVSWVPSPEPKIVVCFSPPLPPPPPKPIKGTRPRTPPNKPGVAVPPTAPVTSTNNKSNTVDDLGAVIQFILQNW